MFIERIQTPDPAQKLRKPDKLVAEMKKTATSTAVTLEEEKRQAREEEEEKEREEKEESAALPEQGSESGNRPQQQAGRINVTA